MPWCEHIRNLSRDGRENVVDQYLCACKSRHMLAFRMLSPEGDAR